MDEYQRNFINEFSMDEWMIFYMDMDKYFMDEKLKIDGMKLVHVITVVKTTPWLTTFVIVGCPLLMILITLYILYIF